MPSLTQSELVKFRELLAKEEITAALYRFSRGIDRGDEELVKSAYHRDSIDHHPPLHGSGHEYAQKSPLLHAGNIGEHHMNSNVLIEFDGDIAKVETYYLATSRRREDPDLIRMIGGRYLDRFERRDGFWLIARRTVVVDWSIAGRMDSASWDGSDEYPAGFPGRADPLFGSHAWEAPQ